MGTTEVTPPRPWWTDKMRKSGLWFDTWVEETMAVWGFCCCGQPEVIIRNMLAYMESCADKPPEICDGADWTAWREAYKKRHPILETDVFWFCAYLADAAGWTEHGGSVNSAWLDRGEAWLEEARVKVPEYEATGWP